MILSIKADKDQLNWSNLKKQKIHSKSSWTQNNMTIKK